MPELHNIQNRFRAPKFVSSFDELAQKVEYHRGLSPEIEILVVLGSFDLLHIGHARYLAKCRELADVVIVLVDPDEAVRLSKGPDRPVIPQDERAEMLAHLEYTDYICYIENYDRKTGLWLRELPFKPDIIVVSLRKPNDEKHMNALKKMTRRLEVFESQAETSTSNKIRNLTVGALDKIEGEIDAALDRIRDHFSSH